MLPLLEAMFRGGSMLEMSKEEKLVTAYLKITKILAQHKVLIPCLLPLDSRYEPRQLESVQGLLSKLQSTAQIYL